MKLIVVLLAGAFVLAGSAARGDEATDLTAAPSGARLVCKTADSFRVETTNVLSLSTDDELPVAEPGPQSDIQALLAGRTADCTAGKHRVRARTSWFEEQWGGKHDSDPAMFVRVWIDQRPLNVVLRVENHASARIDLVRNTVRACQTSSSDDNARKEPCSEQPFSLGPIDTIEFAPNGAFPGPHHDIFMTEAQDTKLCRAFAVYFEGGPAPPGLTMPESVPTPDSLKTWGDKGYRLDADNDGEIDDVVIMDIQQYLLTGTVIAVFERDSVLTGRTQAPWWGDLMTLAMGNDHGGIKRPPTLKAAVWGGPLGLYGNTTVRLHVVAGQTYAQVTSPWLLSYRPMTQDDRKTLGPIEPARTDTGFTEIVVRTLPGMKPQPLCKFTRRSQIFE